MVQGVGFRFTAQRIARKFGIVGWVRNSPDGSVEIVAEAEEEKLNLFLVDLKDYFKDYIHDYSQEALSASCEFSGFKITFR